MMPPRVRDFPTGLVLRLGLGLGFGFGLGCDGGSPAPLPDQSVSVVSCDFSPPEACSAPDRGFATVMPVIERACGSCHDGADPAGPWPLTSYEDVTDWADLVRTDLSNCAMPPPASGVALSTAERGAIIDWILCGSPP
jgi:hypothetical protein